MIAVPSYTLPGELMFGLLIVLLVVTALVLAWIVS